MKNQNLVLKLYAITLTFVVGYFVLMGFKPNFTHEKFEEITVERINIVEPDGKLKMVISNQTRQHPGMFDGEILINRERPPGIIFFNEEQDEVGGLIYQGNKKEGATFVFSIDQYKNDQVMQLRHITNPNGDNKYGLQLWERDKDFTLPRLIQVMDSLQKAQLSKQEINEALFKMNNGKTIQAARLFIGKQYNQATGMYIQDNKGIDRLRVYVDEENQPRIEILDDAGKVVKDLAK